MDIKIKIMHRAKMFENRYETKLFDSKLLDIKLFNFLSPKYQII